MGVSETCSNVGFISIFHYCALHLKLCPNVVKISFSYTKPKGQLPDYESPVVLHSDRLSVEDFCNKLHRSIAKEFK